MALTRQAWSINALSVELGLDRRTLGKRLDGLRPLEEGPRGSKLYGLTDVIRHLRHFDERGVGVPSSRNDGTTKDQLKYHGDFMVNLTIRYLFYMLGQTIPGVLRHGAGLSPERAIDLAKTVMLVFGKMADDLCDHLKVEIETDAGFPPMPWQTAEGRKTLLAELKKMKAEPALWTLRGDEEK